MIDLIKERINLINKQNVPSDYKRTDVGIFPIEWEEKKLGDVGNFYKGKGLSNSTMMSTGIPCCSYGDIYTKYDCLFEKTRSFTDELTAKQSQSIKKGTLLFTGSGETAEEIGKCVCYNGSEVIYAGGDIILYNSHAINPLFVAFQQNIRPFLKQKSRFGQGHSVVHIYTGNIKKLSVIYPTNKKEQDKIVGILKEWYDFIKLNEELIDKLLLQKKALIQKLLKYQNGWQYHAFKDLYIKAGEGGTPSTKRSEYYCGGNIPFVKIEHLANKYVYSIESFITNEGMKNSGAWLIPENSLIFSNGATIGQASINKIPVTTKQGILGIVPSKKVSAEFLYYIVKSNYFLDKVKSITTRGTMFTAYLKDLDKLELAIPNKKEQERIVKILSKIDDNIDLHEKKLSKIKEQQKMLMQLLLTGIVRVL